MTSQHPSLSFCRNMIVHDEQNSHRFHSVENMIVYDERTVIAYILWKTWLLTTSQQSLLSFCGKHDCSRRGNIHYFHSKENKIMIVHDDPTAITYVLQKTWRFTTSQYRTLPFREKHDSSRRANRHSFHSTEKLIVYDEPTAIASILQKHDCSQRPSNHYFHSAENKIIFVHDEPSAIANVLQKTWLFTTRQQTTLLFCRKTRFFTTSKQA